jgi:dynein intermediate chain, cytosolic
VVTSIDWSPQINELFLASYSQNEEGSIKDHVGLVLLWNPALKTRAEFYCFSQSAVTAAAFYPFSNSIILGGCYNGQILVWDIRSKSMPEKRSGISADSHKYPVCGLEVIGTQIANNIVSYSNDGMMCMWDCRQLSKPIRTNRLTALRTSKSAASVLPGAANRSSTLYRPEDSAASRTTSFLNNTVRDELHDINITCSAFQPGDANNYYLGSLNGMLYRGSLHNKGNEKMTLYEDHKGPISGLSINKPS